jgi:hypothetical protein
MRALLVLLALTVSACVSSREVMTPSGGRGWLIECPRGQSACMDEAAEKCPRGYEVLDRGTIQGGYMNTSPQTGQQTFVPTSRGTMTIECRGQH